MSKLNIVDLSTEVELSSAVMSEIGGGMSCDAAKAVAQVDQITSGILAALNMRAKSAEFAGMASGVIIGSCS